MSLGATPDGVVVGPVGPHYEARLREVERYDSTRTQSIHRAVDGLGELDPQTLLLRWR